MPAASPNYVVVRRSRPRVIARALVVMVATVLLAGGGWWFGRGEAQSLRLRNAELGAALDETRAALDAAQRSMADLTVEETVAKGARQQARDEIRALTAQVGELERELRFYRAVLPSNGARGFRVASFEVQREGKREWRWDVLLVQHFKAGKATRGTLEIELEGSRNGVATRLPLAELGGAEGPLDFEFRYFQSLSGRLRLPDGFEPSRVHVVARAAGSKAAVEKAFAWPGAVVLAAAESEGEER